MQIDLKSDNSTKYKIRRKSIFLFLTKNIARTIQHIELLKELEYNNMYISYKRNSSKDFDDIFHSKKTILRFRYRKWGKYHLGNDCL